MLNKQWVSHHFKLYPRTHYPFLIIRSPLQVTKGRGHRVIPFARAWHEKVVKEAAHGKQISIETATESNCSIGNWRAIRVELAREIGRCESYRG